MKTDIVQPDITVDISSSSYHSAVFATDLGGTSQQASQQIERTFVRTAFASFTSESSWPDWQHEHKHVENITLFNI